MKKVIFILIFIFFFTLPLFAQSFPDTSWVRRYNGPADTADEASAIAVDVAGNVYVTGTSYGTGTSGDYATTKYYPRGDVAWVSRYNGSGNGYDHASAIAVNGSSNIYVTGYSYGGSGTLDDYLTIKYDSSGSQVWVNRYNNPYYGNNNDRARAIALDGSGNVCVTGFIAVAGTPPGYYYGDYATIKYSASGNQVWIRTYDGGVQKSDIANAIATDPYGNIFVTGYSEGSSYGGGDYLTIAYNPSGGQLWANRHSGSAVGYYDIATAIAVDNSSNAYVTGYSQNNSSSHDYDYATIAYNLSGLEIWSELRYNGPGNGDDLARAIAVDGSGNVYVTGTSYGSGTNYDYATIKYRSNRTTAWVSRYNGPGNSYDDALAIAVDSSGNVYVTGYSYNSGTSYDYATVKYDSLGNEVWVSRYNGPTNSSDIALAIAVTCFENVYVTGYSYGSGTYNDYATIKYNQFKRGDANEDGKVTVADVVYLIAYLYKGGPPPSPLEKGDVNCDCRVDNGDVVYLVNYLFKGGPQPC